LERRRSIWKKVVMGAIDVRRAHNLSRDKIKLSCGSEVVGHDEDLLKGNLANYIEKEMSEFMAAKLQSECVGIYGETMM
jgi:hypothetical protein